MNTKWKFKITYEKTNTYKTLFPERQVQEKTVDAYLLQEAWELVTKSIPENTVAISLIEIIFVP